MRLTPIRAWDAPLHGFRRSDSRSAPSPSGPCRSARAGPRSRWSRRIARLRSPARRSRAVCSTWRVAARRPPCRRPQSPACWTRRPRRLPHAAPPAVSRQREPRRAAHRISRASGVDGKKLRARCGLRAHSGEARRAAPDDPGRFASVSTFWTAVGLSKTPNWVGYGGRCCAFIGRPLMISIIDVSSPPMKPRSTPTSVTENSKRDPWMPRPSRPFSSASPNALRIAAEAALSPARI